VLYQNRNFIFDPLSISGAPIQYQVQLSVATEGDLQSEVINTTAVGQQSVTLQSQSAGSVANLTIIAVSEFGEQLIISAWVVFRVASVDTIDEALAIEPQNGVVLQDGNATAMVNTVDSATMMEQCQDSVSFTFAGTTQSVQQPDAFSWSTVIPSVGTFSLNTTYTNGLGKFTLKQREVRRIAIFSRFQ
jgi:hypothetical protein